MARLENELSWSRTRIVTFESCKRQYFHQYYSKWGGWEWDAPPARKLAYLLSKMTNLPMLVGFAVHETIKEILQARRDGRDFADPVDFARRRILTETWQKARERAWQRSAKQHPPVFELYYEGPEPDRETLKEVGRKAADCLRRFTESDLHAELMADDPTRWLVVDDGFESRVQHRIAGRPVWVLPDFARRLAGGGAEIWDWKTGSPNAADRGQLLSYALFIRDRHGIEAEQIRLRALYLATGEIKDYPCDRAALGEIEARIAADFERMAALHVDADRLDPERIDALFPMNEDGPGCRACFFKQLCGRGEPRAAGAIG